MYEALVFPHWLYHSKLPARVFQTKAELDAAEKENPGWQDSPAKCSSLTQELAARYLSDKKARKSKFTRAKLVNIRDFDELIRIAKNRKLVTEKSGHGLSRKDLIDMIMDYQEQEAKPK